MRYFKTEALVLRTRPLGEADRLLTLLTLEKGKINAVAKGARKTKSKLAAGVDLFVYAHYDLFRGKTLPTIIQQDILETFTYLQENPAAYAHACYFNELVERLLVEGEQMPEIFELLLEGWKALEVNKDYFILSRAFEMKLLAAAGYRPYLDGCVVCSSGEKSFASPRLGGLVCRNCADGDARFRPFAPGSYALVNYFLAHDLTKLSVLRANSSQKRELLDFTIGLIQYYLEIEECKSLKYIKQNFPENYPQNNKEISREIKN